MTKRKSKQSNNKSIARGPIARKVIAGARQHMAQTVTDLAQFKAGKINAENFQKTVISQEDLKDFDPVHGLYVYAQNQLSVMIELLVELPALDKIGESYSDSMEGYIPSFPPMSPITISYYTSWASFDLTSSGAKKETLCTIATDFCRFMKVDEDLLHLYELMQASRMGIYQVEAVDGDFVHLKEFVTEYRIKTIVPSGYLGQPGEMWLTRIMPPPFDHPSFDYSVAFTTPYVLAKGTNFSHYNTNIEQLWQNYFDRTLCLTGFEEHIPAYEQLMKYGLNRDYWHEYIFCAYSNYTADKILLCGLPDEPASLPHGDLARTS